MKEKMIPAFRKAEGGLFTAVEKADVGSAYQEMEKQGVALMGWADPFMPDASMPKHVEQALIDAIRHPSAPHYTAPIGSSQLKAKIAEKLKTKNHLLVDPERNILITPGSDSGLYFAILPFIEDGDEVLIPSPSYPNNTLNIEIMGGRVVPVPLHPETGYQLEAELLEQNVSEKTKMIVLTHPNNPTTTVYNRSRWKFCGLCAPPRPDSVCEQAFEDFCYENEMITPAAMDGMFERTVTVFSFSKGMGLSGLRVGYLVCGDEIMDSLYANAVSVLGATNTACQKALIAALEDPSFMQEFERSFDIRRQAAKKILNSIPNVHADLPQSGFLCWVDVSRLGDSSQIVQYLVKHAQVAVNDGKTTARAGKVICASCWACIGTTPR